MMIDTEELAWIDELLRDMPDLQFNQQVDVMRWLVGPAYGKAERLLIPAVQEWIKTNAAAVWAYWEERNGRSE